MSTVSYLTSYPNTIMQLQHRQVPRRRLNTEVKGKQWDEDTRPWVQGHVRQTGERLVWPDSTHLYRGFPRKNRENGPAQVCGFTVQLLPSCLRSLKTSRSSCRAAQLTQLLHSHNLWPTTFHCRLVGVTLIYTLAQHVAVASYEASGFHFARFSK